MDLQTLFALSYGMYVLGAVQGGKPVGCTINTVFQLTNQPATLSVCLNHKSNTNAAVKESGRFSVNILEEETPISLIGLFGFRSCRDVDKFATTAHHMTKSGPVLSCHICGYLECTVTQSLELSTHTLFIADVTDAALAGGTLRPMTYDYYYKNKNGTLPKEAPHYNPAHK